MTPKEQAAMQQALEALLDAQDVALTDMCYHDEITALREALANSLKPRCFADYQPNHAIDRACASCAVASECQTGEQAEQEPVLCVECGKPTMHMGNKCYACCQKDTKDLEDALKSWDAAPIRTKDLTDDEIMKINVDTAGIVPTCDRQFHFARAVIAADREKSRA